MTFKQKIGIGLFSLSMIMLFGILCAMLWVFQIHAYNGLPGFIMAYTYDGYFFAPPAFSVIVMFYKHTIGMLIGTGLLTSIVGWLGDKLIGGV